MNPNKPQILGECQIKKNLELLFEKQFQNGISQNGEYGTA